MSDKSAKQLLTSEQVRAIIREEVTRQLREKFVSRDELARLIGAFSHMVSTTTPPEGRAPRRTKRPPAPANVTPEQRERVTLALRKAGVRA